MLLIPVFWKTKTPRWRIKMETWWRSPDLQLVGIWTVHRSSEDSSVDVPMKSKLRQLCASFRSCISKPCWPSSFRFKFFPDACNHTRVGLPHLNIIWWQWKHQNPKDKYEKRGKEIILIWKHDNTTTKWTIIAGLNYNYLITYN